MGRLESSIPRRFTKRDIQIIRQALFIAIANHRSDLTGITAERLVRALIKFYQMGLVDAEKLAAVAALSATIPGVLVHQVSDP